jgi:hypothetical protein
MLDLGDVLGLLDIRIGNLAVAVSTYQSTISLNVGNVFSQIEASLALNVIADRIRVENILPVLTAAENLEVVSISDVLGRLGKIEPVGITNLLNLASLPGWTLDPNTRFGCEGLPIVSDLLGNPVCTLATQLTLDVSVADLISTDIHVAVDNLCSMFQLTLTGLTGSQRVETKIISVGVDGSVVLRAEIGVWYQSFIGNVLNSVGIASVDFAALEADVSGTVAEVVGLVDITEDPLLLLSMIEETNQHLELPEVVSVPLTDSREDAAIAFATEQENAVVTITNSENPIEQAETASDLATTAAQKEIDDLIAILAPTLLSVTQANAFVDACKLDYLQAKLNVVTNPSDVNRQLMVAANQALINALESAVFTQKQVELLIATIQQRIDTANAELASLEAALSVSLAGLQARIEVSVAELHASLSVSANLDIFISNVITTISAFGSFDAVLVDVLNLGAVGEPITLSVEIFGNPSEGQTLAQIRENQRQIITSALTACSQNTDVQVSDPPAHKKRQTTDGEQYEATIGSSTLKPSGTVTENTDGQSENTSSAGSLAFSVVVAVLGFVLCFF